MAEISVLLPSLRPHAVSRVVRELSLTNSNVNYEIIVVSPFHVEGEKVFHVTEKERKGVMHAINEAYKYASGEYIVIWSDDAYPENNCLQYMLDFIKSRDIPFVAGFRQKDVKGKELQQWSVYGKLYVGWLCTSKKTIDAVGDLFSPIFKNYWADPDLSLRVWSMGGEVAVCRNAWVKIEQIVDQVKLNNLDSSFDDDTKAFFDRWHDKLGHNTKRIWTDVNTQVPHSFGGIIRAMLRKVPYLRRIKYSTLKYCNRTKIDISLS